MADVPTEKCLDDFFAKRDKKKKKEKGKGKEPVTGPTVLVKKNKKEKEKTTKSDNQDAQLEKVRAATFVNFSPVGVAEIPLPCQTDLLSPPISFTKIARLYLNHLKSNIFARRQTTPTAS